MTRARSILSVAALAGATALGSAGPAQAAVYSGSWDPAYGSIFPSLGWQASALFNVPDPCLAHDGEHLAISGECSGFDVLSAQVSFYDVANPETIVGSYALDPNAIVTGIDIADHRLTGVDTGFFHYFVPTLAIAGGGTYSFSLILFDGNKAQLIYADPPETSPICGYLPFGDANCGRSANDAIGVFAPVPEPETFALLLAGLGAVGVAARRRRR